MQYLLGYDIGSSSIKAALVEAKTGEQIAVIQHPETELEMIAKQPGWAEQDPDVWWKSIGIATQKLLKKTGIKPAEIKGIGIAYQMHGLVLVDENLEVLRPSIIWCDSRAVEIGNRAFAEIGKEKCLQHLLNSPGNFTASKLKWVKENEPEIYQKIHKILLPGDYIAMKLTGELNTTISGLSEGIFWDFKNNQIADLLLNHYGISKKLLPEIVETFSIHGKVMEKTAAEIGLQKGTPVTYRAGDQPNNALALGVFNPNEIAATGGTSGVVYGIVDQPKYDPLSRINPFAHVNHTPENQRLGLLLCINGAGSQYAWLKNQLAAKGISYAEMERMANTVSVGSDGLRILPFGNGAERMLSNENPGAQINNLQFNRHQLAHFFRAGLEGIAFSFVYGCQIFKSLGSQPTVMKVGNDNLFQSKIFAQTIANLLNCRIEMMATTGAAGAAKASGIGAGIYENLEEGITSAELVHTYFPEKEVTDYEKAYGIWIKDLEKLVENE